MSQMYKIVTTNAGRNAVLLALSQDKSVTLTHMAVGDGNGKDIEPLSSMTELVHEAYRAQINEITFDAAKPDLFTAELFIPQSVGGFYIREIGLFMEDGTLFAVGSTPLTEKPELSSGSASDLLIRMIVRVLDAATISLSIDPAQVLATRDYVDRMDKSRIKAAVDAHNRDAAAHDSLARKEVKIVAGTGLSGGGNLEADRTLAVKYGATAGTACQGNDGRLDDSRTPTLHADSHAAGGADAITPVSIGAAPAIHVPLAASLSAVGHVKLSNAVNSASETEAATPSAVKQAYDKALAAANAIGSSIVALEAYRQSRIGAPHHLPSATLPAGYMWADGSLASFSDWPELAAAYSAGRFNDMLLVWNASSYDKQNYPAKFVPNAANPSGLYLPRLGGLFSRNWTPGQGNAGARGEDTGRNVVADIQQQGDRAGINAVGGALYHDNGAWTNTAEATHGVAMLPYHFAFNASRVWGSSHTGGEFAPVHVYQPSAVYLGIHA